MPDMSKAQQRLRFTCDAQTALAVYLNLGLALRHPLNLSEITPLALQFQDEIEARLFKLGFLSQDEVHDMMSHDAAARSQIQVEQRLANALIHLVRDNPQVAALLLDKVRTDPDLVAAVNSLSRMGEG